ncbi:hypothetical protein ACIBJD_36485 [Kitasatospora sp. NPDC050467]|uniref:hypothetical protein n=1 Tax=Kitasatospora sp. NPDC050467 TaxID=3364053 RepID=UPI0037B94CB1
METGNDARGIEVAPGIDARGIDVPRCPVCDTELRTGGPGRRPVYCGRACSSKAYRSRKTEYQQDAVADALVSSRVETTAVGEAGRHELLELATAVQRATARFLDRLDEARRSEGDDPRCNEALALLETTLTAATGRIVRKAHVLRYEMVVARREAEQDTPGAPASSRDDAPEETTRLESSSAVAAVVPSPGRAVPARLAPAPSTVPTANLDGPAEETTRVETRSATAALDGTGLESTRVGTMGGTVPHQATARPDTAAVPHEQRLALAAERTSTPPFQRGLGAPTTT